MNTTAKNPVSKVQPWKPMSQAEAEAMPPLPRPAPRGWDLTAPPPAPSLPPATGADANHIASDHTPVPGSGFALLKNASPDQLAPFIGGEHPQVIALILSQLEPVQAGNILVRLPECLQSDVVYRIATMGDVTPAVLAQIGESLHITLRDILGSPQKVGGPKVAADIINNTSSSVEAHILGQMDAIAPEVAEAVRNLMFVFADIVKLTDREIQTLLREVDQKDLVVALKAAEEELKTKILSNMSEQVRTAISQEMEFLGPMRLTEVEEVQLRIVQQVRQLEEQGKITVVRGGPEETFV